MDARNCTFHTQGCTVEEAKEGVIVMVAAYNLYLGGYLPRLDPERSVHNRQELKTKYKNIVSMNNSNPQTVVRISNKTQAYVLNACVRIEADDAGILPRTEESEQIALEEQDGYRILWKAKDS